MPRIYIAGGRGKSEIILGRREAHYLKDVLRLGKGKRITVLDGDEGEGYIKDISQSRVAIVLKNWKKIEKESGLSIILCQSILKGEKMDMVLEKAAEIGVTSIMPLVTERVIPRRSGKEKMRRWERIVVEATRLCGRPQPPQISAPVSLNDFLKKGFPGLKIVPWEGEKEEMLFDLFTEESNVKEATVVMGPEGGFSEREVSLLRGNGFKTVSLGPFILRSDTAAIFTLSCLAGFYRYE